MARIGIFNRKKVTAFKKGNKLQSSTSCKSGSVNSTSIDNASTGDSSEPIVATAHVCQGLFNGSENVLNLGDSSSIASLTNLWKFDPTSNIIPYNFGNGLWLRQTFDPNRPLAIFSSECSKQVSMIRSLITSVNREVIKAFMPVDTVKPVISWVGFRKIGWRTLPVGCVRCQHLQPPFHHPVVSQIKKIETMTELTA